MCDQLQQGKIARVSETLEDSAAPPAAQVELADVKKQYPCPARCPGRPSRRAGSCLRLLDPETLRAVPVGGGGEEIMGSGSAGLVRPPPR